MGRSGLSEIFVVVSEELGTEQEQAAQEFSRKAKKLNMTLLRAAD